MSYRTQVQNRNDTPDLIKGLAEGFAAPLVAMLISYIITMLLTIDQALEPLKATNSQFGSGFNIGLFLLLFATINIIESLVIGFGDIEYAIGYVIGAICGLFVFNEILTKLAPDQTVGMIGVIAIIICGIVVKIVIKS
jgi:hypothetical protein